MEGGGRVGDPSTLSSDEVRRITARDWLFISWLIDFLNLSTINFKY